MEQTVIKVQTDFSSILVGEEFGKDLRKRLELDALDSAEDEIILEFPGRIYGMTGSFFDGLFSPSIIKLGHDAFIEKYSMRSESDERSTEMLERDFKYSLESYKERN